MPENVSFTEQNDVQHFALFLDSITKTSSVFSFLTLSTGGRVLIQEYYICRVIKHSFFFFFFNKILSRGGGISCSFEKLG